MPEFDQSASACSTADDLRDLIGATARELGFDYFALLHHAALARASAHLIRLENYPAPWASEIAADSLAIDDPVHLASGRCNAGFSWTDIAAFVPLTPRHRDIFDRSRRHGIGTGFTVPANVPGEPGGSCSFAVREGRALPDARLHEAELIGAHAFHAARRLHGYPLMGTRPHLSRRELQCLRLVARGKTAWEIGRTLGISEATVRQYIKRARGAYDVVSRTQLVVHALRDGSIAFDDVGAPWS